MKTPKFVFTSVSLLGLAVIAANSTHAATVGFVALEGSDATALHHDGSYTPNLFRYLQGLSSLPVLVYNPAGTISLTGITGSVTVSYATVFPSSLAAYSAIYIESPGGCCMADNTALNAHGAQVNAFIAAGGNLAIENYVGGSYDGVVTGGGGTNSSNVAGFGTSGGGPTCTDLETTTAIGLARGFTQPPVDGCWEHQGYANSYWSPLGYISLIAADPAYFGVSVNSNPLLGGSGLLAFGGTLGAPATPEPASVVLFASGAAGLAWAKFKRRRKA